MPIPLPTGWKVVENLPNMLVISGPTSIPLWHTARNRNCIATLRFKLDKQGMLEPKTHKKLQYEYCYNDSTKPVDWKPYTTQAMWNTDGIYLWLLNGAK